MAAILSNCKPHVNVLRFTPYVKKQPNQWTFPSKRGLVKQLSYPMDKVENFEELRFMK